MSELDEGQANADLKASPDPSLPPTVPSDPILPAPDSSDSSFAADSPSFNPDDTARRMDVTKRLPLGGESNTTPTSPPLSDVPSSNGGNGSSLAGAYGSSPGPSAVAPPMPSAASQTAGLQPDDGRQLISTTPTTEKLAGEQPTAGSESSRLDSNAGAIPPSVPNTGWSTMGETPTGPPAQTSLAQGAPKYLPPVDPPGSVIAPKVTAPAKTKGRWGWRALTSFVAGGLVAAAGFGAAQLSDIDSQSDTEVTETAASVAGDEVTTTSALQQLPPVDVDEPAAYVATLLGPAVVQVETDFGTGSGVIYEDGLVLTNQHVVDGARTMRIRLSDGRILPAELEGSDSNTDIAVLSVEKGLDLPIAVLATGEKAVVGQVAIAIGSPFQLQQSVTAGIVSAVDRPLPIGNQRVVAMIQTDAPINPGNSGGALADKQGRVIGINTSIQTDGTTSTNAGVGFAVPIDTARNIADLLVSGAPIESGFLGVTGRQPQGGEAGVEISEVTSGSAADTAGLEIGDRVLSLDGAPVTSLPELAGLVLARQAGEIVELEVVRAGETIVVEATLDAREE